MTIIWEGLREIFQSELRKGEGGQDFSGQYVPSQRNTVGVVQVDICDR
jgi:hypothetical protein